MATKIPKYHVSFVYDGEILIDTNCWDCWWDEAKDAFVVINPISSFYQKDRMSNIVIQKLGV